MTANFGLYVVIGEIGRGGMGVIYKAQDPRLNRHVAIKQLVLEGVEPDKREEFRERFRREAILAAGLNHPNLISIYDVNIDAENSYYVMEFLEGHSYRKELEGRPNQRMTPEEFYPIFKQVCEGLAHAHDMGLVHRDIKPDNIFILPLGKVKLTDFGIARTQEPDNSNLTKPGVMLGTLSYVSPEQLQDARNVDLRADIYSLGIVAYETLAGQLPFTGEGLTSTLMAIVSRAAKPINEVNPAISMDISSVIAKAIRKGPNERYLTVLDFLKDYEKAIQFTGAATSASFKPATHVTSHISGAHALSPATSHGPVHQPGIPLVPQKSTGDLATSTPVPNWSKDAAGARRPQSDIDVELVKPIGVIGRHGEEKGCLMEPSALCARNSRIVVADSFKRNFQVFSREGRMFGESTPGATKGKTAGGTLSKPSGVTIDSRGRIYCVDASDHYVRLYDGAGKFTKDIHNRHGKEGGLNGITCDAQGYLYLSDSSEGCVHIMQAETGTWVRKVGTKGKGDGQLQLPSGLALDRFNQLYVVDYSSSKVNIFSKAGIYQRSFGGKGTGKGMFNVPRGIAIDRYDRVYVCDSLNHRIQVFTTRGDYMFSFGGRGSEVGKFIGPADISIDPENNCLYVADRGNSRIQIFEILQQS
jgi:serine/threonine protein kinase/sugar lactone lactonase YvrE